MGFYNNFSLTIKLSIALIILAGVIMITISTLIYINFTNLFDDQIARESSYKGELVENLIKQTQINSSLTRNNLYSNSSLQLVSTSDSNTDISNIIYNLLLTSNYKPEIFYLLKNGNLNKNNSSNEEVDGFKIINKTVQSIKIVQLVDPSTIKGLRDKLIRHQFLKGNFSLSFIPIYDEKNSFQGYIGLIENYSKLKSELNKDLLTIIIIFASTFTILNILLLLYLLKTIVKPIKTSTKMAEAIANGDFSWLKNS